MQKEKYKEGLSQWALNELVLRCEKESWNISKR